MHVVRRLLDRSIDWLVDWLVVWFLDRSIDWLIGWLVGCLISWLFDRLIGWVCLIGSWNSWDWFQTNSATIFTYPPREGRGSVHNDGWINTSASLLCWSFSTTLLNKTSHTHPWIRNCGWGRVPRDCRGSGRNRAGILSCTPTGDWPLRCSAGRGPRNRPETGNAGPSPAGHSARKHATNRWIGREYRPPRPRAPRWSSTASAEIWGHEWRRRRWLWARWRGDWRAPKIIFFKMKKLFLILVFFQNYATSKAHYWYQNIIFHPKIVLKINTTCHVIVVAAL